MNDALRRILSLVLLIVALCHRREAQRIQAQLRRREAAEELASFPRECGAQAYAFPEFDEILDRYSCSPSCPPGAHARGRDRIRHGGRATWQAVAKRVKLGGVSEGNHLGSLEEPPAEIAG